MKRTVSLGSQSIDLDASMGWLYVYREQYGRDILPTLMPLLDAGLTFIAGIYDGEKEIDDIFKDIDIDEIDMALLKLSGAEVTMITDIAWAMAKNEDDSVGKPKDWVNQFDMFPMDVVIPEIIELVLKTSVSEKNSRSLLEKLEKIRTKRSTLPRSQQPALQED